MRKIWILTLSLFLLFPAAGSAAFSDVPRNHWAYEHITNLSSKNIINGYNNGTFMPNQTVTRAQAAKILARAIEVENDQNFSPNFVDVPTNHWAYGEISGLTRMGVFSNALNFNPDHPLTRAQMSKILVEGFNIKMDNNHLVAFKDVPNTDYWHPYITTIAEVKISNGVTPQYFGPYQKVSRAQMAAFTDRALTFDDKREHGHIFYDTQKEMYVEKPKMTDAIAIQSARLANDERKKAGLPALTIDSELSRIAVIKAEDMAKNNYFDHTSPTYGTPFDMAKRFGYSYRSFGENIAMGYTSPEGVVEGWMNSPGHKANILNRGYTNIGTGTAKDQNGRIYWVHMFSSK